MSKFDELKKKLKDQIFCGIAGGRITDDWVEVVVGEFSGSCWSNSVDEAIDELIEVLDKNWEEKHSTANRNADSELKIKGKDYGFEIGTGRLEIKAEEMPKPIREPKALFEYRLPYSKDEVDDLIESRSNGTYSDISDTASEIIKALGTDSEYTYFFSQIANKLARVKNGYSVEDSLLDIAGYAKLELDKYRGKDEG